MGRLRNAWGRTLSFLLLPASLVPLFMVAPQIVESHQQFDRRHNSGALAAPRVQLTAGQRARFQPVEAYEGAVPVLAWSEVTDDRKAGPRAVTRRAFAEQLAALRAMGFRSISVADYLRLRSGDTAGLPERPILLTFDGGLLDSYRGADRTLQRYGFKATMFVATDPVRRKDERYLTWRELKGMGRSGRWDVQTLGDESHDRVAYDERGDQAPFYAVRRYTRSAGLEPFADYDRRVTEDVFDARQRLEDQGFEPRAIAVPDGDYGQFTTNDPRIAPFMRELLARQFGAFFTREPHNAPTYAGKDVEAQRYVVGSATKTDQIYMWLRDNSPGLIEREAEARAAADRRREARQKRAHRKHKHRKHR